MGNKTNQQLVIDLMSFGPHGALSELFVVEALRTYAAEVAGRPPFPDTGLLSGVAWCNTAKHVLDALNAHLGGAAANAEPAHASEAHNAELDPVTKAKAVAYVEQEYCWASDDTIETDTHADSPDSEFSEGEDGVWVKGWLFCPKEELPEFYPPSDEDDDEDQDETEASDAQA